jgi:hypothetical protein
VELGGFLAGNPVSCHVSGPLGHAGAPVLYQQVGHGCMNLQRHHACLAVPSGSSDEGRMLCDRALVLACPSVLPCLHSVFLKCNKLCACLLPSVCGMLHAQDLALQTGRSSTASHGVCCRCPATAAAAAYAPSVSSCHSPVMTAELSTSHTHASNLAVTSRHLPATGAWAQSAALYMAQESGHGNACSWGGHAPRALSLSRD